MPTLLHSPTPPFAPEALDRYLTAGWRPTGQSVYSSDYLRTEEDALYGCLQLRIPLAGYQSKKRHRKLLRRNNDLFRVVIQKAELPDWEMHAVNEEYLKAHPEKSTENLSFHIIGDGFLQVLNTWESRIYLKNKLIAFSYFDLGERCLYAKAGIYDPAFADFSLGTYTMLIELQWARDNGYTYYHPGYFSPGYPAFNYKLSYAPAEFRDPATGNWAPLTGEPAGHPADPYAKCERKLLYLQTRLREKGIAAQLLEYPSFTARYFYANSDRDQESLVDGPFVLQILHPAFSEETMIIYEVENDRFVCYDTCWTGMQDFKLKPFSPVNNRPRLGRPVGIFRVVASSPAADELAATLSSACRA